jgi:hypothetical protein
MSICHDIILGNTNSFSKTESATTSSTVGMLERKFNLKIIRHNLKFEIGLGAVEFI